MLLRFLFQAYHCSYRWKSHLLRDVFEQEQAALVTAMLHPILSTVSLIVS
jgi:hypothetical protein